MRVSDNMHNCLCPIHRYFIMLTVNSFLLYHTYDLLLSTSRPSSNVRIYSTSYIVRAWVWNKIEQILWASWIASGKRAHTSVSWDVCWFYDYSKLNNNDDALVVLLLMTANVFSWLTCIFFSCSSQYKHSSQLRMVH